jgi:hypothetical protein
VLPIWLLAVAPGTAGDRPDLDKLDRTIFREPTYTGKQPLDGPLAFGPVPTSASGWCSTNPSRMRQPTVSFTLIALPTAT